MTTRFFGLRAQSAALAQHHRLPTIDGLRAFAHAGGLVAYGQSATEYDRWAAVDVDKIRKGAKPGELPMEQPMKFELSVNLKAAQALGLTLPPALLWQADKVIR